jgi:hypothetical protein
VPLPNKSEYRMWPRLWKIGSLARSASQLPAAVHNTGAMIVPTSLSLACCAVTMLLTSVGADQLRVDAVGQDAAADRSPFAGVQIRHGRHGVDAGERGDGLQLLGGVTLDPGPRRIESVDRRAAVHGRCCVHKGAAFRECFCERLMRRPSPALASGAGA